MNKLLSVILAAIAFSIAAVDVEAARRMGGGKSIGKQREAIGQQQAAPRTPPQQQQQATQNTPAQQQQAAPAGTPAQQPSGMSRWLGPLAGLAIGAGLASLFFNNGLGGALLGILLIAALVMGVVFVVRLLRGRTVQEPLRYAGATPSGRTEPTARPAIAPAGASAAPHSVAATTSVANASRWPADFDAEAFVRHAKANFVKLQEAHDRRDLNDLRDFLTPQMYQTIEADVRAAGDAAQKTDVVTLEAEVLDVAVEGGEYVVSVRFSGLIRESSDEPEAFTEVWHLTKPVRGRYGWQLAGIQQA
jgi:predicted lipid-binding transport protein (Tim44 family)